MDRVPLFGIPNTHCSVFTDSQNRCKVISHPIHRLERKSSGGWTASPPFGPRPGPQGNLREQTENSKGSIVTCAQWPPRPDKRWISCTRRCQCALPNALPTTFTMTCRPPSDSPRANLRRLRGIESDGVRDSDSISYLEINH